MKKKVILLFLMFMVFFISFRVSAASSYYYVWYNTSVDIPVYGSLYDYINMPYAVLYENGEPTDHSVVYLRGDALTSEDTILTSKVGTYYLTYTAISDIEASVTVTFNVRDITPPKILNTTAISLGINQKCNYADYFSVTDDCDTKISVVYNDSNVNYEKPGEYQVNVTATDLSMNVSSESFDVYISDKDKPVISTRQELKIGYKDSYNPLDYFMSVDDVDGDISSEIISGSLDTSRLGSQSIVVSSTDSSGNTAILNAVFEVIDDEAPEIIFTNQVANISLADAKKADYAYFQGFIYSISDNCDNLTFDDVLIDYSSLKYALGEYKIIYTLYDESDNKCEYSISVNVLCDSVPEITVTNITIYEGENINYYAYISCWDKYDGVITSSATIDDSCVNTKKKGVYFVTVSVKNSYGKYNYATLEVRVKRKWIKNYWWIFVVPVATSGVVVFFVIKKKKSVI